MLKRDVGLELDILVGTHGFQYIQTVIEINIDVSVCTHICVYMCIHMCMHAYTLVCTYIALFTERSWE